MAGTHKKELTNSSPFADLVLGIIAGLSPIAFTWYPSYLTLSSDTESTVASPHNPYQVACLEEFYGQEIMQELLFAKGVLE